MPPILSPAGNTLTITPALAQLGLPAVTQNTVRARAYHDCQIHNTGCTHTCDNIQIAYPSSDMQLMGRDPNSSDNWICICNNCLATL